ncbi:patatin-like phospholipase family protein [Flexibacterium corallicola]|uniref:patatin-like phospholipase family protein n=1 Tax=Flexibacterium corallicola TaxID=3037259 RepID=UPI00286F1525|nr:patatin-like phospholipase family protein [Pseudovibrio sp. M1P-2-3]
MTASKKKEVKEINLALQGGGSHGAYTWGVLDWLLESQRFTIARVSGTSAGALNAAVLTDGMARGGPKEARKALKDFWTAVSKAGRASPFQRSPLEVLFGSWNLDASPMYFGWGLTSRIMSPYQFNPLNINPLKEIIENHVNFDNIHQYGGLDLYVAATNVRSGKIKIFAGTELSCDTLLASCCIPQLYQAVEIDGEAYWDGCFMGNPPLYPLYNHRGNSDILLVQINPVYREEVPQTSMDISVRFSEIAFNSTLLRKLNAIEFVSNWVNHRISFDDHIQVYLHHIEASKDLHQFGPASQINPQGEFIELLFDIGRKSAAAWTNANFDSIGSESTLDFKISKN